MVICMATQIIRPDFPPAPRISHRSPPADVKLVLTAVRLGQIAAVSAARSATFPRKRFVKGFTRPSRGTQRSRGCYRGDREAPGKDQGAQRLDHPCDQASCGPKGEGDRRSAAECRRAERRVSGAGGADFWSSAAKWIASRARSSGTAESVKRPGFPFTRLWRVHRWPCARCPLRRP